MKNQVFIDMDLDVFGNRVIKDARGEHLIVKTFEFVQSDVKNLQLYRFLELINIEDSYIQFPIRFIQKSVSIFPSNDEKIRKYYSFRGIQTFIQEQNINSNQFFVKPEIMYLNEGKYPIITIHFFFVNFKNDGIGENIKNALELTERCFIHYEDTSLFTDDRLIDLGLLVDVKEVKELKSIPCIPLTYVQYDEYGNLQDLRFDTYWA